MSFDPVSFFIGMGGMGTLAYAARTIPVSKNPWIAWFVGILQYVLTNADKGKESLQASADATTNADGR